MKVAQLSERAEEHIVFRDGLGVRVRALTEAGEAVHRFTLDEAFTPVQQAVQDRVKRLTNLHHVKFARLRGFEKAPKQGGAPVVVSAEVEGIRLADTLLSAAHGLVDVSVGQALQITREVLAALAVLHDSRNVTHGSLAPERVVLTPHGRVLVVEHVLAQALEKLQLPRHQLWRDWRIATPPAAGPVRFDARTDLAQAGLLVLAATLGRGIEEDEYPHRLRGLLPGVTDRLSRAMGTAEARELQAWLERLLPIESRRPFTSVKEAQLAFENLVSKPASSLGMSPARVKALVASCLALQETSPVPDAAGTPAETDGAEAALGPPTAASDSITFIVPPAGDPAPAPAEHTVDEPATQEAAATPPTDDVDIEALLRLAAELEEAAAEPPLAEVQPIASGPVAAFEIVHDEPQEEPSADDVAAVVQEIDLGPSLEVLTESRPAEVVAWDVAPPDLQHLAHERDELQQQFADILSLVAPAAPSPPSSLVQDTVRWSFEPEPQQESEPPVAWLSATRHEDHEDSSSDAEAQQVDLAPGSDSAPLSAVPDDQPAAEALAPPAAEPPAADLPAAVPTAADLPAAAEPPRVAAWMTPVADAIDDVVLVVTAATSPDAAPAEETSEAAPTVEIADDAAAQAEAVTCAVLPADVEVVAPEHTGAPSGEPLDAPAIAVEETTESFAIAAEELPETCAVGSEEEPGLIAVGPVELVSEADGMSAAVVDDAAGAEAEACIAELTPAEDLADVPVEVVTTQVDAAEVDAAHVDAAEIDRPGGVVEKADVADVADVDATAADPAPLDAPLRDVAEGGETLEEPLLLQVVAAGERAECVADEPVSAGAPATDEEPLVVDDVVAVEAAEHVAATAMDAPAVTIDEVDPPAVATVDASVAAVDEPGAVAEEPDAVVDEPVAAIAALDEVEEAPAAVLETPAAASLPGPVEAVGASDDPPRAAGDEAAASHVAADAITAPLVEVDEVVEVVEAVAAADAVVVGPAYEVTDDSVERVEPTQVTETVADSGEECEDAVSAVATIDATGLVATDAPAGLEDVEPFTLKALLLDAPAPAADHELAADDELAAAQEPAADNEPAVRSDVEPLLTLSGDAFVLSDDEPSARDATVALIEAQPSVGEPLDTDRAAAETAAALVADAPASAVDEPLAEAEAQAGQAADADDDPAAATSADPPQAGEDASASTATDSGGARSKRRRSRRKSKKRESAPAPRIVVDAPAIAPALPVVPDVVVAPLPAVHAVQAVDDPPAPLVSVSSAAVSATDLPSSASRRSLVERDVPAWQPPADLRAVGAAAATRGMRAPVAEVPSATDVAPVADSEPPSLQASGTEPVDAELVASVGATPAEDAAGMSAASGPAGPVPVSVTAMSTASIVPEEYLPQGQRGAGDMGGGLRIAAAPQVTTVGDPGYSAPGAPVDAEPATRTVVVFTSRINWRRTIAAGLVLALLESAAFAAAWWWVQPGAKGTLVVETTVPGVEVLLDGTAVGQTPFHDEVRPGRHTLTLRRGGLERSVPVEISLGVVTTQTISWPDASTGALRVTSSPEGAEVVVGGRVRGRTPLTVDGLDAGKHTITLRSDSGTVSASATVVSGETTDVDVPIFAGWIVVNAPVDVAVWVDGTHVGSSLDGQILLAPGGHRIEVASESLGFRETLHATVEPGKVRRLTVTLPDVPLQVTGEDGAEVFVDGQSRGTLPSAVTVPLGTHELVLRRPDGTERRRTLTVRAGAPVTLE